MKRAIFQPARRGGKSWAAGLAAGDQGKPKKAKRLAKPRPDPKPVDDIPGLPAGPRVIVPFPPVELSPNWRGHWSKKSPVAKTYRRLCWALALEAKLKVPDYAGAHGKIAVRLDFFPPDRNSRDDDNVPASFKAGRRRTSARRIRRDGSIHTANSRHRENEYG